MSDKDIKTVAKEFIKSIRGSLTAEQIEEVIQKNETGRYQGCCATHDYVDSNMNMADAVEKAGLPMFTDQAPFTEGWDESLDVVNKAWDLAKSVKFNSLKIDEI